MLLGVREDDEFKNDLNIAWLDLQKTKPDIIDFDQCYNLISELLEKEEITISTMNSKSKFDVNFDEGVNIVVGGNSLGRGVTFPQFTNNILLQEIQKTTS